MQLEIAWKLLTLNQTSYSFQLVLMMRA